MILRKIDDPMDSPLSWQIRSTDIGFFISLDRCLEKASLYLDSGDYIDACISNIHHHDGVPFAELWVLPV